MRGRNHKGNVFVGNLPHDFPDERLAETFDPFGIVLSAAVARDPVTGARLRYGFVDIATEKAAKAAIAGLDGTQIDGSKLSVQLSEKPAKKAGAAAKRPPASVAARRLVPREGPLSRDGLSRDGLPRDGVPRDGAAAVFPAVPRPQPTFQVERRPLPRRILPH